MTTRSLIADDRSAAPEQRISSARNEFVARLGRVFVAEHDRQVEHGFDAEQLLDRLRDALERPQDPDAFNAVIGRFADDLFNDDRWAGRADG